MKHCPNPDCPHRRSTGRPAEYRDEADVCRDCHGPLRPGAAPEAEPEQDRSAPVTVATFSTPHEAHMARATLLSHDVDAHVYQDHTPYLTASSWVQLQVTKADADLANEILERGPIHEVAVDDAADAASRPSAAGRLDDMRPARLERRFKLARWFLYAQAVGGWTSVAGLLETPLLSLLALVGAVLALATALWSKRRPRPAFAAALGLQTVGVAVAIVLNGPLGLVALISFLAVFQAWVAAAPQPPESLQASMLRLRSPDVEIGEAWKEATPPDVTPRKSIRWIRFLLVCVASVVGVVAIERIANAPAVKGVFLGTTDFTLEADAQSALIQRLELARARLAFRLVADDVTFETIEVTASHAIEIAGIRESSAARVAALLGRLVPGWTIDRISDSNFRLEIDAAMRESIVAEALDEVLAGLREDSDVMVRDIVDLVVQRFAYEGDLFWPLESVPVIVGRDLVEVLATIDDFGAPAISFQLGAEAGERLLAATGRMIGRKMAIVLRGEEDAEVVVVPTVEGPIGTRGIIRVGNSNEEAERLARQLRSGSRPMRLTVSKLPR